MSGPRTRCRAAGRAALAATGWRQPARACAAALCVALALAGCGGTGDPHADRDGSTLHSTYRDPARNGTLHPGPGEPLIARTELGPRARPLHTLATLAQLTDVHLADAQSPARVTFLDRLGAPFNSTFRPQEALEAAVLAGAVHAIDALHPQAVIEGGDLIDSAQANELDWALALLRGRRTVSDSGAPAYVGVQQASDPDPFYYRPDVDAPRYPGLLRAATRPVSGPGLTAPWYPVLGNHDALVAGELAPTPQTQRLAVGDRAVWDLPPDLPAAPRSEALAPQAVQRFLDAALRGPTVRVPADPARRELSAAEVVARLRAASGHGGRERDGVNRHDGSAPGRAAAGARLDYAFDVGSRIRVVVLDLVRRAGGAGGEVSAAQASWLRGQLQAAGQRWVLVTSHQPIEQSRGGTAALALLDEDPHVLATIAGHTHRNRIRARRTPAGGYWTITTSALADFPQQARAFRIVATAGGGVAIQTWMLDHTPDPLGDTARDLAYLDAQGGRPQHFAGTRRDRNVTLYRAPP